MGAFFSLRRCYKHSLNLALLFIYLRFLWDLVYSIVWPFVAYTIHVDIVVYLCTDLRTSHKAR